jgi:class 3 adenylate cyclase
VHAGPVVQRDGDYYGRTVNWASRISGKAGPREVLVTADVVEHATGVPVRFDRVGPTELKGIARPVDLYRALPAS